MNHGRINPRLPGLWHGADYNPDQWLHDPNILPEDVRLKKLAGCNVMSVNIFGWAACEPAEGVYTFEWLDHVMDTLYENGVYTILATPSGARPAWMSQKYPEVLRVNKSGVRNLHGARHNHCMTSPVYRDKVRAMNTRLAQRYGKHPGLVLWHVSNEYGGACYCPLCQEAFRNFLKQRYGTLERLNLAWVAFFLAMALANLYVAYNFATEIWVNFKVFGSLGLTLAFVIAQAVYLGRHVQEE